MEEIRQYLESWISNSTIIETIIEEIEYQKEQSYKEGYDDGRRNGFIDSELNK